MIPLYQDLAPVYEAMYHTFIDYEEEYRFYSDILKRYGKQTVVEIGSGTGNLAPQFIENGFAYTGLDSSKEMIAIAQEKVPQATFLEGDMRAFQLTNPVESILITARTISYLLESKDINSTLSCIHQHLKTDGILSFDIIDASGFIPDIAGGKKVVHEATSGNKHYVRKSFWKPDLHQGMSFQWDSTYFRKEAHLLIELGQDNSIVRTFTVDEINIFLTINGFEVKEMIERSSYAFPTQVVVAKKIG